MAIKVSGTSVINDSRQLQNIASLDSTTISTINSNVSSGFTATTTTGPSSAGNYNTNPGTNYKSGLVGQTMTTAPPSSIIVAEAQFSSSNPVVAAVSGSFSVNVGAYNGYYGGFLTTWANTGTNLYTMKQNLYWDSITSSTSGTGTYYIDMGVIYIPAGGKVYLLAGNPANYGQWEFAQNAVTINGYYQTAS
jgi:hypothetical protein